MNEDMISNHNSVVKSSDFVYMLGDIGLGASKDLSNILRRLKGRKFLIAGNHDRRYREKSEILEHFEWIKDYHELYVKDGETNQMIVLGHYAHLVWNGCHRNSWNLHGHSHGNLVYDPHARRMDVGVDPNGYYPVSYEQAKGYMSNKTFKPLDHHRSK